MRERRRARTGVGVRNEEASEAGGNGTWGMGVEGRGEKGGMDGHGTSLEGRDGPEEGKMRMRKSECECVCVCECECA